MIRSISVVGSTGSIGVQTLSVAEHLGIAVKALSANTNVGSIYGQIRKFKPELVSLADSDAVMRLKEMIGSDFPETEIACGQAGNN